MIQEWDPSQPRGTFRVYRTPYSNERVERWRCPLCDMHFVHLLPHVPGDRVYWERALHHHLAQHLSLETLTTVTLALKDLPEGQRGG